MASEPARESILPPLPREHGAWFILAGSALVGPAITLHFAAVHAVLLLGAFCALVARSALRGTRIVDRIWAVVLTGLALVVSGALLLSRPSVLLLAAGGAAAVLAGVRALLELWRLQRHVAAELVGLAVLTTLCPASLALSGRSADMPTLGIVAANDLYFFVTVPFVRVRVFGPKLPAVWRDMRFDALSLAVAGAIVMAGAVGPWAAVAFAVQVLRTARVAVSPPQAVRSITRLGLIEVAATAYYCAALAGAVALSGG